MYPISKYAGREDLVNATITSNTEEEEVTTMIVLVFSVTNNTIMATLSHHCHLSASVSVTTFAITAKRNPTFTYDRTHLFEVDTFATGVGPCEDLDLAVCTAGLNVIGYEGTAAQLLQGMSDNRQQRTEYILIEALDDRNFAYISVLWNT